MSNVAVLMAKNEEKKTIHQNASHAPATHVVWLLPLTHGIAAPLIDSQTPMPVPEVGSSMHSYRRLVPGRKPTGGQFTVHMIPSGTVAFGSNNGATVPGYEQNAVSGMYIAKFNERNAGQSEHQQHQRGCTSTMSWDIPRENG